MGSFIHEILEISERDGYDVMELCEPLVKILKAEEYEIKVSPLPNLGKIINILNRFFKYQVIGDAWDIEKFSLKEASNDFEVEK